MALNNTLDNIYKYRNILKEAGVIVGSSSCVCSKHGTSSCDEQCFKDKIEQEEKTLKEMVDDL